MKFERGYLSVCIFLITLVSVVVIGIVLLVIREVQLDNEDPNRENMCVSADGQMGGSKCYKNGREVKYE